MWEPPEHVLTAPEIIESIDPVVAGLKDQKARLATMISRHAHAARAGLSIPPANALVIGPTGGGKTWMVRAMLEASGLPYIEVNATQYSEVGYIGADLSSMFSAFWEKYCDRAAEIKEQIPLYEQWGVVMLDEFDKWRIPPGPTLDRGKFVGIQAEMLKIVEGDTVNAKGKILRTHRLMFIAMGAFQGLGRQIGTVYEKDHMLAEPIDIIQFGFTPELVGRIASIIPLPHLDVENMVAVFKKNFLPRYEAEANAYGVELVIDEAAIIEMAGQAVHRKIGARAFTPIMEKLLWKAWSQAKPGATVHVTVQSAMGGNAEVDDYYAYAEDDHGEN